MLSRPRATRLALAAALAGVLVSTFLLAAQSYRRACQAALDSAHAELVAAADLKVQLLTRWVSARAAVASNLARLPVLNQRCRRLLAEPGAPHLRREVEQWLNLARQLGNCSSLLLLAPGGIVLASSPAGRTGDPRHEDPANSRLWTDGPVGLVPAERQRPCEGFTSHEVAFRATLAGGDLQPGRVAEAPDTLVLPDRELQSVSPPAAAASASGTGPSAATGPPGELLLTVDPEEFLFPILAASPRPHASGETVLAHREAEDVIVLHPLAGRPDQVSERRHRMSQQSRLPSVQAALGKSGRFEAEDYRGVPVLAEARPVAGTPWVLVVKADRDAVLEPARERYGWAAHLTAVVLLLLGAGFVLVQRRAEREHARRLESLSNELLRAQEAERGRLSRELHDDASQSLTALKVMLHRLRALAGAHLHQEVDACAGTVSELVGQLREMALELRPSTLDDHGLEAAVRWLASRQAKRAELELGFVSNLRGRRLDPAVETAGYRVVQEAIGNVLRHAKARRLEVELQLGELELVLTVRDDGAGFDAFAVCRPDRPANGAGLPGLRERVRLAGGTLDVESPPRASTVVRARFPVTGDPRPGAVQTEYLPYEKRY